MIFLISVVAMVLIIWFRTEAFVEYCHLLGLDSLCDYRGYNDEKKNDVRLTYHDYLLRFHHGFLTRLLTCPICMSMWITIFMCVITLSALHIPVVMVGGLTIYLIIDKLLG